MRIRYWSAILVFLFTSCSDSATPPAGSLAFVGPGAATQQVYVGEGATIEITVKNTSANARSLGKLVFSANGVETDAQLLDLEGGQSLTYRFYDRPQGTGIHAYDVVLFQGKKKVDSLSFSVTAIPPLIADLGWVSASSAPLKALSDTTIHVDAVARNFGEVRAFATVEVHVLSSANTDVTVGRFNLPTMEAGATAAVSVDLSVFGNISGTARLVLFASTADTDTTNDTITVGPLDVVAPNWSIALVGPINAAATAPIPITAVVFNRTEFTLPPHSFDLLYGDPDVRNIDVSSPFPARVSIPTLQPGTGAIITSYQLAASELGLARGVSYPIWARLVDDVDSLTDSSDDNVAHTTLYIYDQLPDLAAVSITAATHAVAGGMQLSVAARFANDGSQPTAVPYEIWLTGPSNVRLLKTRLPGTMFSHSAQNLVTNVTLPTLPNGAYALRVTLDAEQTILEFQEDNNTAVDPVALVAAPDISGSVVLFAPAPVAANGEILVQVQWTNLGNAAAAGTASLWMVSGTTEKTQDFVDTVAVPALYYQQVLVSYYYLQPLRGAGAYTWVVSAAGAPGETVLENNRFQAATLHTVTSLLSVVSRSPLSNPNPDTTAVADIDTNGAREMFWGSDDGFLFAARVTDQAALWPAYDFDKRMVHPPVLADMNGDSFLDVVVTAGGRADGQFGAGTLAALDGTDGTLLWSIDETGPFSVEYVAPPAVGDVNGDAIPDIVLEAGSATGDGYVAVISGGTRAELWRVELSGLVGGAVLIPDLNSDSLDDVFVASVEGDMGAFSGKSGNPVWSHSSFGASFVSSPAVGDVTGSTGAEIILTGVSTSLTSVVVVAYDSATGVEHWRFEHRGTSVGAPVIVDVNGDGKGEVVVPISVGDQDDSGAGHSKLVVLNGDGTPRDVVEFYGKVSGAAGFSDADNTGFWSLGVATAGPSAWVEVGTPYDSGSAAPWFKYRGNLRNTGRLGD